MSTTSTAVEDRDTPQGVAFALAAYLMWGGLPLYLKAVSHIPPTEVVAHRIMWSVPIAGLLLILLRRTHDLRAALSSPHTLAMGCVTATLISVNWGIYVWSISVGKTVDAALGYYINPLFSIFLGAVLLGERMSRAQMVAVALAAFAVVVLTVESGSLPLASIGLVLSWGFYAFFKKSLPIGPNQGFMLEVLILLPFALGYVIWLGPQSHFVPGTSDFWMLMAGGIVTAVPLICYANGAKLVRLSTIGIMQYIAPTLIFLVAVFVFGEEFDRARMIAFPIIWLALIIYTTSMVRQMRARGR